LSEAAAAYQDAIQCFTSTEDDKSRIAALESLGFMLLCADRASEAIDYYYKAAELCRISGNADSLLSILHILCLALIDENRFHEATEVDNEVRRIRSL
jgi:tetratricopeptide (TPR) repeat protein